MGYPEGSARPPRRRAGAAHPSVRGFTLVELMIVMVVAAVVLAIGAPQFSEFRRNNRLSGASNDLLAALQLARTEAIKRQSPVAVCATADPRAAEPSCTAGPFSGWLVFEDANADCQRAAGEPKPIRAEGPLDGSLRAAADGICVAFAPTGFALDLPVGVEAERVLLCDDRGTGLQAGTSQSAARGIAISRTGRASITRDSDLLAGWGLPCN
jgi:type IV fimbrial biogenesis protein FimT